MNTLEVVLLQVGGGFAGLWLGWLLFVRRQDGVSFCRFLFPGRRGR